MYHRYKIVLLICCLLLLCTQNFSFAQGQVTFNPTDDSFVLSSSPTSNRGAASDLRIRAGSKTIYTYLKFDVNALGGAVLSAKIRLKVLNGGDDGGTIFSTANAWDEGSIIFNNAPPTTGSALSSAGAVAVDDIVEFDVTSAISGTGIYSFRIHSGSSDRVLFSSKEGSVAPELVIQYASGGNLPPVANAGPDQTVTDSDNSGSENVTLDGSGSSDPDGSIASYDWS
ncbi:MAG: DNRLRE domain-containing protein, partial [bacterium]